MSCLLAACHRAGALPRQRFRCAILVCLLIVFACLCITDARAADPFAEGISAYNAQDYAKAFALWKPLAEAGNANAQHNVAYMLEHGQGVQPNPAEARQWYTKAAEQGHADAQVNLGSQLYHGTGGARDLPKAFAWYKRAADQGNPQAQSAIGDFYLHGLSVPQNVEEAVVWYEKAARQKRDGKLALFLGQYYMRKADEPTALAWLHKAASDGNQEAATIRETLYTHLFPAPASGWQATPVTVKRKTLDLGPSAASGATFFVGLYRTYTAPEAQHTLHMAITINNLTMLGMLDVMHTDPASMDAQKRALLTQVEQAGFRPSTYGSYKGVSGYNAAPQLSVIGLRLNGDITFELSVATEGTPIPASILKAYLRATDLRRIAKVLHGHGHDALGLLRQQPAQ